MKHTLSILTVLATLLVAPMPLHARAHDANGFSLGLVLGDPSGLTLRSGLSDRTAIQAHFGFSLYPGDAFAVMVDWTYDAWDFLRGNPSAGMLFYFGFGGKAQWFTGHYYAYNKHGFDDRTHYGLGVRGLVGLRIPFRNAPFDLFFEAAPIGLLFVTPNGGAYYDADFALGFRYRF